MKEEKRDKKRTKERRKKERRKFGAETPHAKIHDAGSSGAETQGAEKPQCGNVALPIMH